MAIPGNLGFPSQAFPSTGPFQDLNDQTTELCSEHVLVEYNASPSSGREEEK